MLNLSYQPKECWSIQIAIIRMFLYLLTQPGQADCRISHIITAMEKKNADDLISYA
jgi:hypothetical protein